MDNTLSLRDNEKHKCWWKVHTWTYHYFNQVNTSYS